MAPPSDDFQPTPAPTASSYARDHGLRRSRRTTRWIAVTAAAGAAALGGFYTHLLPGGSAAPAPAKAQVQYPAASTATTVGKNDEGREEPNRHEDDADDDEEGSARVTQTAPQPPAQPPSVAQPAPQPPAQPPTATRQQPQTTTGAS
ncbi:hypothetical protein ACIGFK_14015 [Streptomyces sp. NPDC085524]|uniref:hypothetical protein n=1 Tax=Streptomyces sp. NPDC085524 TaxID=3365728 RepID=UPI0037D5F1E4